MMDLRDNRSNRLTLLLALGSCSLIAIVSYHAIRQKVLNLDRWTTASFLAIALSVLLVASVLFVLSRELKAKASRRNPDILKHALTIQGALVFALFLLTPASACVLAALCLARVRRFYSLRVSLYLLLFTILTFVASMTYYYGADQGLLGIAIFTLMAAGYYSFTLIHSHNAEKERELKQEAQNLNRQLLATRELLAHSSRQSERLRISRDIHDLLGHQLTGLILNLEVASHLSTGEAGNKVKTSLALAKSLLGDLRSTVGELRQGAALDFNQALERIIANIPELQVDLSIEEALVVGNAATAETLLRCIQESLTNILRHANATRCCIRLYRANGEIVLHIDDNGSVVRPIAPGNGLKGMFERIDALSGKLRWGERKGSFFLEAILPLEAI